MVALDSIAFSMAIYTTLLVTWFVVAKVYNKLCGGSGKLILKRMSDGVEIYGIDGDRSTEVTYKKMFLDEHYFRNGLVSLEGIEKPLVVDVGANIGLFAKYVAQHYPTAEVMSFEPIPALSTVIRRNTASYSDRVCVEQVACGSHTAPQLPFHYSPSNTACNSHMPRSKLVPQDVSGVRLVQCTLLDGIRAKRYPTYPTQWVAALLGVPIVRYVPFILMAPMILFVVAWNFASQRSEKVLCRAQRLSDVLGEYDELAGRKIDLLKVSVWGSEWDVLQGVDEDMWEQVQQVVVEVYALENNVEKIRDFLGSVGFDQIRVHQASTEVDKLMKLCTVVAIRRS